MEVHCFKSACPCTILLRPKYFTNLLFFFSLRWPIKFLLRIKKLGPHRPHLKNYYISNEGHSQSNPNFSHIWCPCVQLARRRQELPSKVPSSKTPRCEYVKIPTHIIRKQWKSMLWGHLVGWNGLDGLDIFPMTFEEDL